MSEQTASKEFSHKRTWLAALLTVFVPGLGHLYIQMWGGAILWFLLYFVATVLLFPDQSAPDELSIDGLVAWSEAMPLEVTLTILGITALCMVDVYIRTKQINRHASRQADSGGDIQYCPNCGKELDEDIDFCHWCTTELETATEDTDDDSDT